MIYNNIKELREALIEELKNVDLVTPIKLPYDKELVYQLLFENNRLYKMPCLNKIDFSNIDFSGIDITNTDFTGLHGVKIDPQTIKNQNLSGTICNGVEFIGSFKWVKIRGTDFTGSKGAVIIPREISNSYFKGCKFSGVTFVGPFYYVDIAGADFTGSKGAVINLQWIYDKDASNTKFADTIIKGSFKSVKVRGADFTNAYGIKKLFKYEKGVKFNPKNVFRRDISYTVCNGVEFINFSNNIKIEGTNFTGSKGAFIDFNNYRDLPIYKGLDAINMSGTKLSGVELYGVVRAIIHGADFTGSKGAQIDPQLIPEKDMTNTICNGVKFVEKGSNNVASFKGVKIEGTDFTGSIGAQIDPQEVDEKNFSRTKCCDVIFNGSFEGTKLHYTDFTGSIGAKINPSRVIENSIYDDDIWNLNRISICKTILKEEDSISFYKTILKDVELISFSNNLEDKGCVLDGCIYGIKIIKEILIDIFEKYKNSNSIRIRTKIVDELKKYNGIDKILLPYESNFIKIILFDGDKFATEFIDVLEKLDFKNVDFSGFDVSGVDFSKLYGVTLNLDTIKNKDISNSILNGVRIIGSFDGVNKTNAILDGAYYEEQSFENDFREKIKVLSL